MLNFIIQRLLFNNVFWFIVAWVAECGYREMDSQLIGHGSIPVWNGHWTVDINFNLHLNYNPISNTNLDFHSSIFSV